VPFDPAARSSSQEVTRGGWDDQPRPQTPPNLLHEYTGRGPTRARTTIGNDLIVCVLADTLTNSERKLVDAGEERLVLEQRSAIQRLMSREAIATIEDLIGRSVTAFMSNNHIDPDLAVETFVLAPAAKEETA
jgi:uncharacterized protein YbcI